MNVATYLSYHKMGILHVYLSYHKICILKLRHRDCTFYKSNQKIVLQLSEMEAQQICLNQTSPYGFCMSKFLLTYRCHVAFLSCLWTVQPVFWVLEAWPLGCMMEFLHFLTPLVISENQFDYTPKIRMPLLYIACYEVLAIFSKTTFWYIYCYRDWPWFSVFKHSMDHKEGVWTQGRRPRVQSCSEWSSECLNTETNHGWSLFLHFHSNPLKIPWK